MVIFTSDLLGRETRRADTCLQQVYREDRMGAVSYFAMSAYQTAVLQPPHLAAIMPWEGISDLYREVNTVGGIPNLAFKQMWMNLTGNGLRESEDHAVASIEHPVYDAWWQSKSWTGPLSIYRP